jgi:hypothetical protein
LHQGVKRFGDARQGRAWACATGTSRLHHGTTSLTSRNAVLSDRALDGRVGSWSPRRSIAAGTSDRGAARAPAQDADAFLRTVTQAVETLAGFLKTSGRRQPAGRAEHEAGEAVADELPTWSRAALSIAPAPASSAPTKRRSGRGSVGSSHPETLSVNESNRGKRRRSADYCRAPDEFLERRRPRANFLAGHRVSCRSARTAESRRCSNFPEQWRSAATGRDQAETVRLAISLPKTFRAD